MRRLVRSATALSWGVRCPMPWRSRDVHLARTWLLAFVLTVPLAGCIFPEPPEYHRQQTPPFLWSPIPTITEVVSKKSGQSLDISVNVTSEDNGDDLLAFLYLNYLPDSAATQKFELLTTVPAGTLNEVPTRQVVMTWTVPERSTPGTCEQLSLVVTHRSHVDTHFRPNDDSDIAVITWWLDINETDETLGQCPRRPGGTQ
jgi:hypothetical protein